MHYKSQIKHTSKDNPNIGLQVKGRNKGETKYPSSHRRNQMIRVINRHQNRQDNNEISQPFCLTMSPIYVTITYPRN